MPPEPTQRNRAGDPGAELFTAAASSQKRLVDALDALAISTSLRAEASGSAKELVLTYFMPNLFLVTRCCQRASELVIS